MPAQNTEFNRSQVSQFIHIVFMEKLQYEILISSAYRWSVIIHLERLGAPISGANSPQAPRRRGSSLAKPARSSLWRVCQKLGSDSRDRSSPTRHLGSPKGARAEKPRHRERNQLMEWTDRPNPDRSQGCPRIMKLLHSAPPDKARRQTC